MANGHGGKRSGAGRPRGARNIRSEETAREIEESGLTPLQYLMDIVRDEEAPRKDRIECARAAAPFVHARLSSVDMDLRTSDKRSTSELTLDEMADIMNEKRVA